MDSKQQIKPMSKDEEFRLIKLAQQGDKTAYERIFKQWIPFIYGIVLKYSKKCSIQEYIEDAVQECSINFNRAVNKFDLSRNKRFSTYLYHWVRQALEDFQRRNTMGQYFPRGRVTQTNKYLTAHNNLLHQLEHKPTIEQLANYLGWSKDVVKNVQKHLFKHNMVSLDYISKAGLQADEIFSGNDYDIDSNVEMELLQNEIEKILNELNPKYKYVLAHYFGLNNYEQKSIEQMSKEFGISNKMVYRIKDSAQQRFKYLAKKYNLREFL